MKKYLPFIVLAFGVAVCSSSALLIKSAQELAVPSFVIAATRLGLASLILTPFIIARHRSELANLKKNHIASAIAAGSFLAIHFACWIGSLKFTGVSSAAALVSTTPVWTVLASIFLFKDKTNPRTILGVTITLLGSAFIFATVKETAAYTRPMAGNVLALTGAVAMAGYFFSSRLITTHMTLAPAVWLIYSIAAVILTAACLAKGFDSSIFNSKAIYICLTLAIGPQLIGHSSFNWGLQFFSPTLIAVAILAEPIGASALSAIFLGDIPTQNEFIGLIILLTGILTVTAAERGQKSTSPKPV